MCEPGVVVVVVVDDAHDRIAELSLLSRARSQEGMNFRIVAPTWPDQIISVAAAVPDARTIRLRLLEREAMNKVVESAGVSGYRARRLILDQAEGRPGWALALTEVLLHGNSQELLTGEALLREVEGFLRRTTQSPVAVDALACVAALGFLSQEDTPQLAQVIGAPVAELGDLLSRSATNGLLDRGPSGWRLQPALTAPLIARWFFSQQAMRPISTLIAAFPDREGRLSSATVEAASTGVGEAVGCIYSVQAVDQRFLLVAEERRQVPAAPSGHPPAFSEAAMPVLETSTRA
jgi:hypothetical protein